MKKYVKEHAGGCTSIYGYAPFTANNLPTVLKSAKDYRLAAPESARVCSLAAKDLTNTFAGWGVMYDKAKRAVLPMGYYVINMKQIIIAGGATKVLE